jgi:hypothetical protein
LVHLCYEPENEWRMLYQMRAIANNCGFDCGDY